MKRNMVPLLGIAFVVAIISTGVFYGLFAGRLRSASADVPGQTILVAARDLDRGTVVQAKDMRRSQLKGTLRGSFSKPEELEGATLLASAKENEPLIEDRLALRVPKTGAATGSVPPGMRAVSIRVAESDGILPLLHPTARIDVQAVLDKNNVVQLRTVLQNVEVLAVGAPGANRSPLTVVTVLTRAQDADALALADAGAQIRLALRNPLDEGVSPRRSMALGSVFQGQ
jgi:Flp pilus assembly protein CpaB